MRAALLLLVACGSSKSEGDGVAFKRDYAKAATWTYAYHQTMTMTTDHDTKMESTGTMTLVSNKDKTATLTIDAALTVNGKAPDEKPAPITMKINEDGTGDRPDQMALIGLLFPVPKKPLKVGDVDTMTITIPAQGLAGKEAVSGPMEMKLVGFAPSGCAQLESKLLIHEKSDVDEVGVKLDGQYCLNKGDGALVTASVTIDMQIADSTGSMKLGGTLTLDRK